LFGIPEVELLFLNFAVLPPLVLAGILAWILYRLGYWPAIARVLRRSHGVGVVLEFIALGIAMVPYASWRPPMDPANWFRDDRFFIFFSRNALMEEGALLAITILPLMALAHIRRRRWRYTLACFLWFAGLAILLFELRIRPMMQTINEINLPGVAFPKIGLPMTAEQAPVVFAAIAGFFTAFYMVRRGFAWWRYILGLGIGYTLSILLMNPATIGEEIRYLPVKLAVFTIFGVVAVALPKQARAFERAVEVPLRKSHEAGTGGREPFWGALLQHSIFLVALIVMGLLGLASFPLEKAMRSFAKGPDLPFRSPARVNAVDILGESYLRMNRNSYQGPDPISWGSFARQAALYRFLPPDQEAEIIEEFGRENWNQLFEMNEEPLARYREAAMKADHYRLPVIDGERIFMNPMMFREASRLLAVRSRVHAVRGEWRESLSDIEAIWRMGALEVDGSLVTIMIMTAIRGIGNDAAYSFLHHNKDNPEALAALDELIRDMAPRMRREFPYEKIKRFESGMSDDTFVPVAMPSLSRAYGIYYMKWYEFDQVVLRTALERYSLDHGQYPENLDALVPGYIQRIPREPIEGLEYEYLIKYGEPMTLPPEGTFLDQDRIDGLPALWELDPDKAMEDFEKQKQEMEKQENAE